MSESGELRPACACTLTGHTPRVVALTGGPGAGKTAVLEVVQRHFCRHVVVLPEAATILFGGGFPRRESLAARRSAQRAIYRVQVELERLAHDEGEAAVVLCDRGTVDGVAYWPDEEAELWAGVGTSRQAELDRYDAVIHLRTPASGAGYDQSNPVRRETAAEAAASDERILISWSEHPVRTVIGPAATFLEKLERTMEAIAVQLPPCCRQHWPPRA